jgi:hypothetical protein
VGRLTPSTTGHRPPDRNPPDPSEPSYYEPFEIRFETGSVAAGVRVPARADVLRAASAVGLALGRPAIFISGGAGGMLPAEIERTRPLITEGLARFAEDYRVTVVDGGTDAGIMKLVGDARQQGGYAFPLVGVAPAGAVRFGGAGAPDSVPLNAGHSHFVLVEGDRFGDESDVIARLAVGIARGQPRPAICLVINGGEITRQETYERAVDPAMSGPLLVVEGSGRFGDELAGAARGTPHQDARIDEILKRSDVRVAPADAGPARIYAELERLVG